MDILVFRISTWGLDSAALDCRNKFTRQGRTQPSLDRHNNLYFFSDREHADQNLIYVSRWKVGRFSTTGKTLTRNQCRACRYKSMDRSERKNASVLFDSRGRLRQGRSLRQLLEARKLVKGDQSRLGTTVNTDDFSNTTRRCRATDGHFTSDAAAKSIRAAGCVAHPRFESPPLPMKACLAIRTEYLRR